MGYMIGKASAITIGFIFLIPACTNMEEDLLDGITADNFFQSEEEFISVMGQAYISLGFLGGHGSLWSTNEVASDELVVTVKGGDWYSGGELQSLHNHTFGPNNPHIITTWTVIYNGIATCNRLLFQFQEIAEQGNIKAEPYIYELRALRALYYYWALDAFGNIPLVADYKDENVPVNASDFQTGRTLAYNFVESELNDVIPQLDSLTGGSMYGRMNQAAALALRCKLYLNANIYTGGVRQEYNKAITDADAVAAFGFSLADSYGDNFTINNEGSPENILVIPYDKTYLQGFNWAPMSLHYESQNTFNFTFQPWNGYAVVEEFYNSYVDPAQNPGPQGPVWLDSADFSISDVIPSSTGTTDSRLSNFLVGPQFNANGSPTIDPEFENETSLQPDPDGGRLNFTPHNNELFPFGWRQGGARIGKYEYEIGGTENASNDFVIFRFADILLTKAEALWRTGDAAGALTILNQIRMRAGVDALTDLDGPPGFDPTGTELAGGEILNERGREMFAEMTRRQDLIRFGQWGQPWWEKPASSSNFEVFPIPQLLIDTTPGMFQNPGY